MSSNRTEYYTSLETYLPDNSSQQISPQDVRTVLIDLVESIPNFITDRELNVLNLGSPEVRTTRVGDLALNQLSVNPASYSEDNSSFGYYSLAANYSGIRNTALGSYALGCSLYGSDNVSAGFFSSAANLTGSGNVSLGNYTLRGNKHGDFNIAIGHGAGNNIEPTSNYKFYLGAAPIDLNSSGVDFTHLMYGDLQNFKLAIAARSLHEYATLQVSGSVSPTIDRVGNLGHPYMSWGEAYIASGIGYAENRDFIISRAIKPFPSQYELVRMLTLTSGGKVGVGFAPPSGNFGFMTVDGDLIPARDKVYSLGHPQLKWNGYFGNIVVSGTATINDLEYVTKTECLYECKTLHLATSGLCSDDIYSSTVCGYLSDEGIDGAGFEVHSSGVGYRRDYRFIYRFPDQTLSCLESDNNYSRSKWESNISLGVTDGNHVQTQRVLSKDNLSLVTQSGCFGIFVRANEQLIAGNSQSISTAVDRFNFVHNSGFSVASVSTGSGLTISNKLLSRGKSRGFDISYIDALDTFVSGQMLDRLVVKSIDASRKDAIVVLRSGVATVGINNFEGAIPQTILNVQSTSGCDARFTAYNLNPVSVQMLSQSNVPVSGFEILYTPKHPAKTAATEDVPTDNTVIVDFSVFSPSGSSSVREGAISIAENNFVGIGTTRFGNARRFSPNSPLTVQHDSSISGTVALRAQSISPSFTANFGKFYVKPYAYSTQTHAAYFMDGAGNEFLLNPNIDERYLYVDSRGNTFGGATPNTKPLIANVNFNTALGFAALASITATSSGNVSIAAAEDFQTGSSNVFIGRDVAKGVVSANRNVVVGANQFNSTGAGNNNIIIGHNNANNSVSALNNTILIGSGLNGNSDFSLSIGFSPSPLITGSLGGVNGRKFEIRNGSSSVFSDLNDQEIRIANDKRGSRHVSNIIVKDYINTGVNNGLMSIRFADSVDFVRTLVDFDYNATYYNPSASFSNPVTARPFVGVSGDLRVLGGIRFADGTYLDSSIASYTLNFIDLDDAVNTPNTITTTNSHIALSVPSGNDYMVGKMTLQALADYVGSGFAAVSNNCNHVWTNVDSYINTVNNESTVFIGCNVGIGATGWKNSVVIGSEAGRGATTPNVGLATDTSSIFIGNRAGYEADNVANQISIGTNAGRNSVNSSRSIYIGSNAGDSHNGADCIGIGFHALRGSDGVTENGQRNIEIVAGLLDNQRLMHASGNLSDRLNIQNTIAGDTAKKKISIGHTTLNPDAPLSVRRNSFAIPAHGENNYIQTWWCNGSLVAYIDCNGSFYGGGGTGSSVSGVLEGVSRNTINAPGSPSIPTSGIIDVKDGSWNTYTSVWAVNRDTTLTVPSGAYVQIVPINGTYRFQWVSCGV